MQALLRRLQESIQVVLPGFALKRWLVVVFWGLLHLTLGGAIWFESLVHRLDKRHLSSFITLRFLPRFPRGLLFVGSGAFMTYVGWQRFSRAVMRVMLPERSDNNLARVLIERRRAERGRRVVVLGAEPGIFPVVRALLSMQQDVNLTVILSAAERGSLAEELRSRFGLSGSQVLRPIESQAVLYAELEDGRLLEGETTISHYSGTPVKDLFLSRDLRRVRVWESDQNGKGAAATLRDYMPNVNEAALEAIREAELLVLAPGKLYTQLLPSLTLPRLAHVVQQSRAQKVFVANLMTEPGKTDEWTVTNHLEEIRRLTGVGVDYVIVHKGQISNTMLEQYRNEGASPVQVAPEDGMSQLIFADTGEKTTLVEGAVVIEEDVVTEQPQIVGFQRGGDTVLREMPVVRHDPQKLAPILDHILSQQLVGA